MLPEGWKKIPGSLPLRQEEKIPVIGTYDNHFNGNWKQKAMKAFSHRLFKRYFNYMMVPGIYQYEFMRYLGYKRSQILFPQYCADTRLFRQYYEQDQPNNSEKSIFFLWED